MLVSLKTRRQMCYHLACCAKRLPPRSCDGAVNALSTLTRVVRCVDDGSPREPRNVSDGEVEHHRLARWSQKPEGVMHGDAVDLTRGSNVVRATGCRRRRRR